jgi:hypothetical protein
LFSALFWPAGSDLFINYAGHFKCLDLLGSRAVKAYLDVDPNPSAPSRRIMKRIPGGADPRRHNIFAARGAEAFSGKNSLVALCIMV